MTSKNIIAALSALALGTSLLPGAASAATCTFAADLQVGSVSEEVRCLQQYLNGEGFLVASEGVGSKGRETNQFQAGTKAAVIKWQVANSLPGTGYFGPASRAKYASLAGGAPAPAPSPAPAPAPTPAPAPAPTTAMSAARTVLLDAQDAIETAKEDLDDSDAKKGIQDDAQEKIDEADAAMLKALYAYLDESYSSAEDYADEAKDDAEEASDILADEDEDEDEDGDLTFALATIFRNETVVKVEYDGDEIVFTTDSDDEDDIIDDILDEVDDDDLTAGQVEDELEIDEEDRNSKASDKEFDNGDADEDDADDAIDEADDAIEEAKDAIDDADEDGDDVNEANDLLDDAEDAMDDARDAFDDEDWDEAVEKAEEARDLAEEAVDAL